MKWQEMAGLVSTAIAVMSMTFILNEQVNNRLGVAIGVLESRNSELRGEINSLRRDFYDELINQDIRIRQLETNAARRDASMGTDRDAE